MKQTRIPIWVCTVSGLLIVLSQQWYHHLYDEGMVIRLLGGLPLSAWVAFMWWFAQRKAGARS